MVRSRKRFLTQWTLANDALIQYFQGNQSKLANYIRLPRPTVTNFFNADPISESQFQLICLALRLNCQEISAVSSAAAIAAAEGSSNCLLTLSLPQETLLPQLKRLTFGLIHKIYIQALERLLVEQAQERCRQKILCGYSRIRLLSGEEIGVYHPSYVDVWWLEKPDDKSFNSSENLLKRFNFEPDRLNPSLPLQRYSGLEAANKKTKLVILGKPGSGKTTFLRRLAVDWSQGIFQPERIAILIELKQLQDEKWNLLNCVDQELGLNNWRQLSRLKTKIENLQRRPLIAQDTLVKRQIAALESQLDALPLQCLLKQGKFLILMDGFNELPSKTLRVIVQEQLRQVLADYPSNRFILTCRTQATAPILDGFTSVELADFSPIQVEQFVQTWFRASGHSEARAKEHWQKFSYTVSQQPALKELIMTPMLLSLMCLVFQAGGALTSDKTWLYRKGVKLLLGQWNDEKQTDGWVMGAATYRKLAVRDKEALMLEIVAQKLENPKNFGIFEKARLVDQITRQLHLTDWREAVEVLKTIEAQHGLLIEQADGEWSFSDLSFQEHLTVQWLTQLSAEQLAKKIINQPWQEVVKQLVKSQQPADRLVRLIKQAIEQSIAREPAVQIFLNWLFQKCKPIQANYQPAAIRAFYYGLNLNLDDTFDRTLDPNLNPNLTLDLDLDRALARTLKRALDLDHIFDSAFNFNHTLNRTLDLNRTVDPLSTPPSTAPSILTTPSTVLLTILSTAPSTSI